MHGTLLKARAGQERREQVPPSRGSGGGMFITAEMTECYPTPGRVSARWPAEVVISRGQLPEDSDWENTVPHKWSHTELCN